MKRTIALLSTLVFTTALAQAAAVLGKPAPDFTVKDIEGKTHRLADFKGKLLVLEAYNYDCPYSAHHYDTGAMPELQAWATHKEVIWLVVNSVNAKNPSYRSPAAAKEEWAKLKMKATAWIDDSSGTLGRAYELKTTPHLIVIDKNGVVAYNGAIDDKASTDGDPRQTRNYVREALTKLLAGEPVAVRSTKPYGCSVKYSE
jgi:hypothetical protein